MFGNLLNLDESKAEALLDKMDEQQIRNALVTAIEKYIVPHIDDVRNHATHAYDDPEQVRKAYEQMPDEKQQEEFNKAYASLIAALAELRDNPIKGGMRIKTMLREPWTVEALLLLFHHEDVPEHVAREQKDFITTQLQWAGVHVLPEMYTDEEIREVFNEVHPDKDPEDVMDGLD